MDHIESMLEDFRESVFLAISPDYTPSVEYLEGQVRLQREWKIEDLVESLEIGDTVRLESGDSYEVFDKSDHSFNHGGTTDTWTHFHLRKDFAGPVKSYSWGSTHMSPYPALKIEEPK